MTNKNKKYKVGAMFCGGCNCYFDRAKLYNQISNQFAEDVEISIYRKDSGVQVDLLVIINGCQSECLMEEEYNTNFIVINNRNYQEAIELIKNALSRIELN
jgi:hypothetical protein